MCGRVWAGACFPNRLVQPELAAGTLVQIADVHLDVPLYWQCWKLDSPLVADVTAEIRSAAGGLRRRA